MLHCIMVICIMYILKRGALCLNFVCVYMYEFFYNFYFVFVCISNASISTVGNQLDEHFSIWLPAILCCIANIIMIAQFLANKIRRRRR